MRPQNGTRRGNGALLEIWATTLNVVFILNFKDLMWLLESWAAMLDVVFILDWQSACLAGPTMASGGHRWRVALTDGTGTTDNMLREQWVFRQRSRCGAAAGVGGSMTGRTHRIDG